MAAACTEGRRYDFPRVRRLSRAKRMQARPIHVARILLVQACHGRLVSLSSLLQAALAVEGLYRP